MTKGRCLRLGCASLLSLLLTQPAGAETGHGKDKLPQATNLAQDAGRLAGKTRDKPVFLILVSQAGCHYCDEVRSSYLAPLYREKPNRLHLREVAMDADLALVDFSGQATTQGQFAARYKVKTTPTLLFLDDQGEPLAKPLVGAGMAGFYGGYLQNAIDASLAKSR